MSRILSLMFKLCSKFCLQTTSWMFSGCCHSSVWPSFSFLLQIYYVVLKWFRCFSTLCKVLNCSRSNGSNGNRCIGVIRIAENCEQTRPKSWLHCRFRNRQNVDVTAKITVADLDWKPYFHLKISNEWSRLFYHYRNSKEVEFDVTWYLMFKLLWKICLQTTSWML